MKPTLRLALLCLLAAPAVRAANPVDYSRDIKPILAEKCYACHGGLKQKGKLRLDAAPLIAKGGRHGAILIAGNSAGSPIVKRVLALDGEKLMPPEGDGEKLLPRQVELLKAWIDQGAKMPAEPIPPDPLEHWAYRPPRRPSLPASGTAAKNPIDAFLAAELARHKLTPVGPAPKHVLLRRVYLDLIGLPPTRAELEAFRADTSPDAYDKVVDRLLASPRHGERWGRHWMDVWRYSDWSGYKNEIRDSQRHIWRWRDWIVESVNEDKGYERMILEMLAADELAPGDDKALRATGFLARNWYKFNRNKWLDDTVEHTMKAFVGLTINCTKCHDHKFDPIAQESYYQMRAIFEPHDIRANRVPGELDVNKDGLPRAYDAKLQTTTYLFLRGDEKQPDKSEAMTPGVPEALRGPRFAIKPIALPVAEYYPHLKDSVLKTMRASAQSAVTKAEAELKQKKPHAARKLEQARAGLAALDARSAADRAKYFPQAGVDAKKLAEAASLAENRLAFLQAELSHLAAQEGLAKAKKSGKPEDKKTKDAVAKAMKAVETAAKQLEGAKAKLDRPGKYTPLGQEYPRTSTGRRLALARWIAHRDHPLTARVAVNHIWLRHFGSAFVQQTFDLGLRAPKPRHADLLDWLAVEFMESGWSMKKLHRLIVTSQAYRRDSSARGAAAGNLERDPDNHYLWRMNTRRLEAEAVRDSVLQAAGELDLTMGGPDLDPGQGQKSKRRSLYFRHAYEKKVKFLELFDGPSENECYRRSESVVPQQALALANSTLSVDHARLLAGKLAKLTSKADDKDAAFIRLGYRQVLSRDPSDDELNLCKEFLTKQTARLAERGKLTPSAGATTASVPAAAAPAQRARENLIHVLMNHNDFVTVR